MTAALGDAGAARRPQHDTRGGGGPQPVARRTKEHVAVLLDLFAVSITIKIALGHVESGRRGSGAARRREVGWCCCESCPVWTNRNIQYTYGHYR